MTAPVVRQRDTAGWFGHPRGLSTLFFTEMWERFSFYGLKALLILFMTAAVTQGGLAFSSERAGGILGCVLLIWQQVDDVVRRLISGRRTHKALQGRNISREKPV